MRFVSSLLWVVAACRMTPAPTEGGASSLPAGKLGVVAKRLRAHVVALAGSIGERNDRRPRAYEQAAGFIRSRLEAIGYGVRESTFPVRGVPCRTLEATLIGKTRPREIVLVGAHYDSARGTPGADDNASGVAALLEIARFMRRSPPARSVRFVLFPNEEPPHYRSKKTMGSLRYAAEARRRGDDLRAVLVLETIGYYSRRRGSQKVPRGLRAPKARRGDFVAIVGNPGSRALVGRVTRAFRASSEVPALPIVAPATVRGIDWSDHASFWAQGYSAVMITDTALFRNPNYHRSTDTPETLDYGTLAKVVRGLAGAVGRLASGAP